MSQMPLALESSMVGYAQMDELLCPTCDQQVSPQKFEEIQAREREHAAIVERELEDRFARAMARSEAERKAQIEKIQKEAAATVEQAKQDARAREVSVREEATNAAMIAMAPKLAEAAEAKEQLEALKANHETILTKRLEEQNEAKEKEKTEATNAEKAKAFEEKLKLEEKLQDLTRQLQKKRADELGEGAEIDLFEDLKREFPGDEIRRVKKGEPGADIVHNVVHAGKMCGTIIYDSKNRARWSYEYATKLRRDQLAAKADHAILSALKFPENARQIHIYDNVLIANPARVVILVHILRKHLVQTYSLRLSNEARTGKSTKLYEFIMSDVFAQLLDRMATLADKLLDIDVSEKKAHDKTWKTRGGYLCDLQKAHGDLSSAIDRIIDGDE
jgi:Uncharacterized protein conserved in bacteria (DUF2130)